MNPKSTSSSNAPIAFTLPISCQICLGKVKQPVVCPNQHVFCGPCLEVWLERNQQCPACRVQITADNPCRQILGGMSPQTSGEKGFSCRELRQARMELMYKDYENEIDRLEAQLEATRQDNKDLRRRLHNHGDQNDTGAKVTRSLSSPEGATSEQDRSIISLLNRKIKDATVLYDQIQEDLSACKKENTFLTEQTTNLTRENQTLRLELANRSPRRFGRYTVAALEGKVEASERQIRQLQKALEKSDNYTEELQNDLSKLREGGCTTKVKGHVRADVASGDLDLDSDISKIIDESNLNDSELPSRITMTSEAMSDVGSEAPLDDSDMFNHHLNERDKSSFDLDVPSPMAPAGSKVSKQLVDSDLIENSTEVEDSFQLPRPSSRHSEPTPDTCKKKLRFTCGDEDFSTGLVDKRAADGMKDRQQTSVKPYVDFSVYGDHKREREPDTPGGALGPTGGAGDLNVSMTPDLEDCMRIMDAAQKKLDGKHAPKSSGTVPEQLQGHGHSTMSVLNSQSQAIRSTVNSAPQSTWSMPVNQSQPVSSSHATYTQRANMGTPSHIGTTPSNAHMMGFPHHLPPASAPPTSSGHNFASSLPVMAEYPRMEPLSRSMTLPGGPQTSHPTPGPQSLPLRSNQSGNSLHTPFGSVLPGNHPSSHMQSFASQSSTMSLAGLSASQQMGSSLGSSLSMLSGRSDLTNLAHLPSHMVPPGGMPYALSQPAYPSPYARAPTSNFGPSSANPMMSNFPQFHQSQ